eukprot:6199151-Pleurochrysis_carterae.AAC.2
MALRLWRMHLQFTYTYSKVTMGNVKESADPWISLLQMSELWCARAYPCLSIRSLGLGKRM